MWPFGVNKWTKDLAGLSNPNRAIEAAKRLGASGDRRSIGPLIAALGQANYPGYMVSAAAARALANFRDERTVHPLIAQASHQGEAGEGAIWALGELRNEGSVPTLVRVLEDRSSTNRTTAAEALGKIGGVTAMRALAKYFWHPPAVWDKETGLTVVQRYGDSNIVLPLIQFWGKSEGCVDAKRILVAILRRYAQSSTVDVLHAAAAFADQPYTDFRSVVDERYGSNIYKEEILDLGEVRRLAKEELDRRGLST